MKSLIRRIKNAQTKSIVYYCIFGITCLIALETYITWVADMSSWYSALRTFIDTICPIAIALSIIVPLWIWVEEQDKKRGL